MMSFNSFFSKYSSSQEETHSPQCFTSCASFEYCTEYKETNVCPAQIGKASHCTACVRLQLPADDTATKTTSQMHGKKLRTWWLPGAAVGNHVLPGAQAYWTPAGQTASRTSDVIAAGDYCPSNWSSIAEKKTACETPLQSRPNQDWAIDWIVTLTKLKTLHVSHTLFLNFQTKTQHLRCSTTVWSLVQGSHRGGLGAQLRRQRDDKILAITHADPERSGLIFAQCKKSQLQRTWTSAASASMIVRSRRSLRPQHIRKWNERRLWKEV